MRVFNISLLWCREHRHRFDRVRRVPFSECFQLLVFCRQFDGITNVFTTTIFKSNIILFLLRVNLDLRTNSTIPVFKLNPPAYYSTFLYR